MPQLRIPAVYMRGGTSKGVFFLASDLPADPAQRDKILLRVTGSPDRYGQHIDGMGGATSSTSKVVLLSKSTRPDCDVDYLFGAVAIKDPIIDWSGNCGNLSAAVGPFAISSGLLRAPANGMAQVRIWQANIRKKIVAHVPMRDGEVEESGPFELDGVAFPSAEIVMDFLDPAAEGGTDQGNNTVFPTGNRIDTLDVAGLGAMTATLINAGNPTVFIQASSLGLVGTELQRDINTNSELLAKAEAVRAAGAVAMGLATTAEAATQKRPATPKLAFVAKPASYTASDGRHIPADSIDVLARMFSMGLLHHAVPGTGAIALAVAAAIPDTVVQRTASTITEGRLRLGHPSGTLTVAAEADHQAGEWVIRKVTLSRSARRLMEGWVRIP